MSTSTKITVDQYHEMIRRGEFEPREEHHVELLYGEIVPTGPICTAHHELVAELTEWSFDVLPRREVRVLVHGAVSIFPTDSEPEPDIAWARRFNYRQRNPTPDDVRLVIEVSDSSLAKDRGIKARLYAESGVTDYWIVNVPGRCVEVRRGPDVAAKTFATVDVFRPGEDVRPLAFPDAVLPVSRLFPD